MSKIRDAIDTALNVMLAATVWYATTLGIMSGLFWVMDWAGIVHVTVSLGG